MIKIKKYSKKLNENEKSYFITYIHVSEVEKVNKL